MKFTPRTAEEIVERVREIARLDLFGAERTDLLTYVPFESAKEFLKEGADQEEWDKECLENTQQNIVKEIREYMPFAWDKANNARGLSANRSISHMRAWVWLLGHDELAKSLFDDYNNYGKPQLVQICELPEVNLDWRQWDDNHWSNSEDGPGTTAKEALGRS